MAPVSPAKWLCCIEKPDMTIWITNTQQIFAALNAAAVFFLFPFLWSAPDKKTKKRGGGLDEVQAAALVTAREAMAPGPKVMHQAHPCREAVAKHK